MNDMYRVYSISWILIWIACTGCPVYPLYPLLNMDKKSVSMMHEKREIVRIKKQNKNKNRIFVYGWCIVERIMLTHLFTLF